MERKIEKIDLKLTVLFNNLEYTEYIAFIKGNKKLKLFDDIMGKTDINVMPKLFRKALSEETLDEIEAIIDAEIKRRNLA